MVPQNITCAYPPRHVLQITPQVHGEGIHPLEVYLNLEGTDDNRKFLLANPAVQAMPYSPLPQASEPASESMQSACIIPVWDCDIVCIRPGAGSSF